MKASARSAHISVLTLASTFNFSFPDKSPEDEDSVSKSRQEQPESQHSEASKVNDNDDSGKCVVLIWASLASPLTLHTRRLLHVCFFKTTFILLLTKRGNKQWTSGSASVLQQERESQLAFRIAGDAVLYASKHNH